MAVQPSAAVDAPDVADPESLRAWAREVVEQSSWTMTDEKRIDFGKSLGRALAQ